MRTLYADQIHREWAGWEGPGVRMNKGMQAKQTWLCKICSVQWLWEPVLEVNEIGFELPRIGVFGISRNIRETEPLVDR